jgi:hypothetical protein
MDAFAGSMILTVTCEVSLAHGGDPERRYEYTPEVFIPGVKIPEEPPVRTDGPDQIPPVPGAPPIESNRETCTPFTQRLIVLSVPALGDVLIVRLIVIRLSQPAWFTIVSLYVPVPTHV